MLETIASGYGLIEGPRVDGDGNLFFSDVTNGGVYRRSPSGEVATVVPKRRGVGGIALHADGGLVVSGKNICHAKDGASRILFQHGDIPGFNDIFTDSAGRVYAGALRSDPFKLQSRTPGELWRIEAEGQATEMYGNIGITNGIGASPDGRLLYHADSAVKQVIMHDITVDGTATKRRVFATLNEVPDGLAVDESGRVWVAVYGGGCATCFAPDGTVDHVLEVPAKAVTSLCFGGQDRRDLYIVTADNTEAPDRKGTIFHTRVDVPGLAVPPVTV